MPLPSTNTRVFISYSHASDEHKVWVKHLADQLRARSIDIVLDQDDLRLGQLIDRFQREGIQHADRVLVICSDSYVQKANADPHSGAGQERALMSIELAVKDTVKFIPVLRDNSRIGDDRLPQCLGKRLFVDFTVDADFGPLLDSLVAEIERGINA